MEMPAFLPKHLGAYRAAVSDEELLDQLMNKTEHLLSFFYIAADDETWSANHYFVMEEILRFLTTITFENQIETDDLQQVQQKIQEHITILDPYLPLDLIIEVEKDEFHVNSLLFIAASPFFKEIIRYECLEKKTNKLILKDLSLKIFKLILEFVKRGEYADLWKENEQELKNICNQASSLELVTLKNQCELILKRYINRDTALLMLIQAHVDGWQKLRHFCYQYINSLFFGIKFHETNLEYLAFEFLEFNENALSIFKEVKGFITHLIGSKMLIDTQEFSHLANECTQLIQLNISLSNVFSDKLLDVRKTLSGLDVSSCNWLNDKHLNRLLLHFSKLKELNLSDNLQLDYNAWGTLSKAKDLRDLNISRNPQINDDDFSVIVHACSQLMDFNCSDCKKIGDKGFFELSRSLAHLRNLNLKNCQISDGILVEIAVKSNFLETINLTRCKNISDQAIVKFVKQSRSLKKLEIHHCNFRDDTLEEIKQVKPYLLIHL